MRTSDKENRRFISEYVENTVTRGGMGADYVPEQERNFDAGHTARQSVLRVKGYEEIDGKMYKVIVY